jgi:hypothetical protein
MAGRGKDVGKKKKTRKHRKRIRKEDPAFWLHPHPPDCSNRQSHCYMIHRGKKERG